MQYLILLMIIFISNINTMPNLLFAFEFINIYFHKKKEREMSLIYVILATLI